MLRCYFPSSVTNKPPRCFGAGRQDRTKADVSNSESITVRDGNWDWNRKEKTRSVGWLKASTSTHSLWLQTASFSFSFCCLSNVHCYLLFGCQKRSITCPFNVTAQRAESGGACFVVEWCLWEVQEAHGGLQQTKPDQSGCFTQGVAWINTESPQ